MLNDFFFCTMGFFCISFHLLWLGFFFNFLWLVKVENKNEHIIFHYKPQNIHCSMIQISSEQSRYQKSILFFFYLN